MKHKSFTKLAFLPILIALLGSLLPNAFSAWAGGNKENISISKTPMPNSPCYIFENNKEYNFPTIESAVGEANKKGGGLIYVRPGTASSPKTVTISKDITLKDGVALILPYSERTYDIGNKDFVNSGSNEFAPSTKKVTSVRLADEKTITLNGGSIIVGGIAGGDSNSGLLSATTSTHCELVLGVDSEIVCNKKSTVYIGETLLHSIESWGYIRRSNPTSEQDNSQIIMNQGSLLCPFVIYDMKGASNTSNMLGKTFPFSIFDFPNLEESVVFNFGSELYSIFRITTNGAFGIGAYTGGQQVRVLGPSGSSGGSLFTLESESSSLHISYKPTSYATPSTKHSLSHLTTTLELYGKVSLNSIKVKVSEAEVDSADYFLPLSYRFNIIIKNNTEVTINNKVKFMSGVKFLAESGSKIQTNADVIIFSKNYESINDTATNYVAAFQYPYDLFPGGADFTLNGTAKVLANAAGFINTTAAGAILDLTGSAMAPITIQEYYAYEDGLLSNTAQYKYVTESNLVGNTVSNQILVKSNFKNIEYKSLQLNNSTFYWEFPDDNFIAKPTLTSGGKSSLSFDNGDSRTITLTATCETWSPNTSNIKYELYKGTTLISSIQETKDTSVDFKEVTISSTDKTKETIYKVKVTLIDDTSKTEESDEFKVTQTVVESGGGGGPCLIGTSKVLLSNGQTKFAENLTKGDKILAFDHSSGKFVSREIIFNAYSSKELFEVIKLTFDNGNILQIATGHGLFNVDRNTYEIYYGEEFYNHIGETFLAVSYDSKMPVLEKTKLVDVEIKQQYTCKYTPLSEYDINCIADGMLTIPDDIEGMFDSFSYNEDFTYNLVALQEDIDKYGVYTYEDVKDVVHPYVFEVFNFKYWKAFIGKGTLSYEKVNHWISAYMDQIVAFNNLDWDTSKQVPLGPQHG